MIEGRLLDKAELDKIWTIDRSEVNTHSYFVEKAQLKLKPDYFEAQGWPPNSPRIYAPILENAFEKGGWFYALFAEAKLLGIAVLAPSLMADEQARLQLMFFHISRPYRNQGLGKYLFELAKTEARARGAKYLYISATPNLNTIRFYLKQGCQLAASPDPELFALEPQDIHLLCPL